MTEVDKNLERSINLKSARSRLGSETDYRHMGTVGRAAVHKNLLPVTEAWAEANRLFDALELAETARGEVRFKFGQLLELQKDGMDSLDAVQYAREMAASMVADAILGALAPKCAQPLTPGAMVAAKDELTAGYKARLVKALQNISLVPELLDRGQSTIGGESRGRRGGGRDSGR